MEDHLVAAEVQYFQARQVEDLCADCADVVVSQRDVTKYLATVERVVRYILDAVLVQVHINKSLLARKEARRDLVELGVMYDKRH